MTSTQEIIARLTSDPDKKSLFPLPPSASHTDKHSADEIVETPTRKFATAETSEIVSEVKDARGSFRSISARLSDSDTKIKNVKDSLSTKASSSSVTEVSESVTALTRTLNEHITSSEDKIDSIKSTRAKGATSNINLPDNASIYKVIKLTSWSQNSASISLIAKGDSSKYTICRFNIATNLGYEPKIQLILGSNSNGGALSEIILEYNTQGDGFIHVKTNTTNVIMSMYLETHDGAVFISPEKVSSTGSSLKVKTSDVGSYTLSSKATDGVKFNPDGTLEQWGYANISRGDTWEYINLPVAYPDNNYNIQLTSYYTTAYKPVYTGNVIEPTRFGVAYEGTDVNNYKVYWRTIGKVF